MRRFWRNYRRIRLAVKFSSDPQGVLAEYKIDRVGGIAY